MTEPQPQVYAWAPQAEPQRKGLGMAAVGFGAASLLASFVFGLLAPLGLVAIALGILAVIRKGESTVLGGWGIALGALSVLYGAGWLWYAFSVS